ncbi:MAG: hypothetical protein R2770_05630 [Acidimicrobiales bacterium]
MTTERNSAEQLLDVFLYAPVGLALEMCDRLPDLADKGRQRLGNQAPAARLIGEMAVTAGRKKLEDMLAGLREQTSAESAQPAESPAPADDVVDTQSGEPFGGYDAMTAVDIIGRLVDLSDTERAAVRSYEASHKGRRTVLGKLDQLDGRDG